MGKGIARGQVTGRWLVLGCRRVAAMVRVVHKMRRARWADLVGSCNGLPGDALSPGLRVMRHRSVCSPALGCVSSAWWRGLVHG